MSIVKIVKRENPFVMIDKSCLEDPRLSFKAKGILAYLLTKPDDWRVMLDDIVKHSNEGIDSIRSGMKELITAGYAELKTERSSKGHVLGKYYEVKETPSTSAEIKVDEEAASTDIGKTPTSVNHRHRENTDVGISPTLGKSDPTNNNIITNNKTAAARAHEGEVLEDEDEPRLFKNSVCFNLEIFSALLSDWAPEKIKFFYLAALNWSNDGKKKKTNWASIVREWDMKEPYESRLRRQHQSGSPPTKASAVPSNIIDRIRKPKDLD